MKTIAIADSVPAPGTPVRISGWGLTSADGADPTHQLMSVLVNIAACGDGYAGAGETITARMFCASSPGKDFCDGDTGGEMLDKGLRLHYLHLVSEWDYTILDE